MGLNYGFRIVPFACNTSTGTQAITISSSAPGKTPKGAILVISGATTLDSIAQTARLSIGMCDGTRERCIAYTAEDGAIPTSTDTGYAIDNAALVRISNANLTAEDAVAIFSSFSTDTLTIDWTNAPGSAWRGWAIIWYGDDLQVYVGNMNGTSTTAPGFQPDGLVAAHCGQAFSAGGAGAQAQMALGFAGRSPSITQSCAVTCAEDTASPTSSGVVVRDNVMLTSLTSSGGTVSEGGTVSVSSFDTNGFTVTNGSSVDFMYLAFRIAGRDVYAGAATIAAGTATAKSSTAPGFRPGGLLMAGTRVAVANTVGSGQGNWSFGAYSGSETASASINSRDNQGATGDAHSGASSTDIIALIQDTTYDWKASATSLDATGWTITVNDTSAGGGDRLVATLALEAQPQDIAPSGIATATAFGTAVVGRGARNISATGIASATAFGTATVARGAVTVAPTGIASTTAFGTATVARGAVTVAPTGIASATAFGTPTILQGVFIVPEGIASTTAFGTATVTRGAVTVTPTGIASGTTFGTATVSAGAVTLEPAGIASATAFGTATVAQGGVTVSPSGIASITAFGTPVVLRGGVTIAPSGIGSTSAFGTATVTQSSPGATIAPTGIASGTTFGTATVTAGGVTITPTGIASATAFGTPTVSTAGAQAIAPAGIASTTAFGRPILRGGLLPITMKKRIHDAICDAALRGRFIQATYPADQECVLVQGLEVEPRSIECNEIKNAYGIEGRQGRSLQQDNTRWAWLLIVRFDVEVIPEPFEQALLDDPICVPRLDNEPASRQARILLVDCDYKHPPRGSPSNGSELRYRFEAVLSPK